MVKIVPNVDAVKSELLDHQAILPNTAAGQPEYAVGVAPFSTAAIPAMLRDPRVLMGLQARAGALGACDATFASDNDAAAEYAADLFRDVWAFNDLLSHTSVRGHAAFVLQYRASAIGRLRVAGVRAIAPSAVSPLMLGNDVAGIQVGSKRIMQPRSLWTTYHARYGSAYGESVLSGAHPAWVEKHSPDGVKDTLARRMAKSHYMGHVIRYPAGSAQLPSGEMMSYADMARDMLAALKSGSTLAMPSDRDENGNLLWSLESPKELASPAGLRDWRQDVDSDILQGLGVPSEILEAGGTGSGYSGRSIPMLTFLSIVTAEFSELLRCIHRMIISPLCRLQFGPNTHVAASAIPLARSLADDVSGSSIAGSTLGKSGN